MNDYVKLQFQSYYREVDLASITPVDLPKREFGFIIPDKKGMIRHKAFLYAKDYKSFLVQNVPIHAYYSATLYNSPWKDRMDLKDYTGCDLIFDIDCDHIDTPCKQEHDTWTCKECGKDGTGKVPEKCPSCNGMSFEEKTWLCDDCLVKAKSETVKLIDDFLIRDFGVSPESMGIYFSGQRGFHVHLESEKYRSMATDERREFADYITSTGISLSSLGFNNKGGAITGFMIKDPGWRGRIATKLLRILEDLDRGTDTLALSNELKTALKMNKEQLEKRLTDKDPNWTVEKIKDAKWNSILNYIIADVKCEIDVPVTIDIHRLIRAPNTLHGKTGFMNIKLTRDQLTTFDPFTDAVWFKGKEERIKMLGDVPRFRIEDRHYGPYVKDDIETMSIGAAVFLMCKNLGVVA